MYTQKKEKSNMTYDHIGDTQSHFLIRFVNKAQNTKHASQKGRNQQKRDKRKTRRCSFWNPRHKQHKIQQPAESTQRHRRSQIILIFPNARHIQTNGDRYKKHQEHIARDTQTFHHVSSSMHDNIDKLPENEDRCNRVQVPWSNRPAPPSSHLVFDEEHGRVLSVSSFGRHNHLNLALQ
mmetsp:Transcript_52672/g.83916  ORF Transcript_52672/g.83916 Transcript_52672/m.83916 type:complete len:179 (-) Transcript_52672:337-873(-)